MAHQLNIIEATMRVIQNADGTTLHLYIEIEREI